ncbi:DDE transposase [Dyadobacter luteus]|uniref:DDE transposase n=1 Tax=Dyadobacter luteus TaxID=2259619 RepID=A0A3D8Y3H0_9BACT|nr:transposase [Dyadobacter luteus]REA56544.1 DDE transposase [Dyadobacter luteus]
MGLFYQLDGKLLEEQYVGHLSGFRQWDQFGHAQDWILFPDNIGPYLSIDETSLSHGELYTVITNKEAKGKKGALVAMVKGVESEKVINVLSKIGGARRKKVKEVTLDLAATMERIARRCFPKARLVSDRFHVQQLASDAVQQIRIEYRWEAIERENQEIELAKETGNQYIPEVLTNGDSLKQLLARSRHLLFKDESKWTPSQQHRAEILFRLYPTLETAYELSRKLSHIFTSTKDKGVAFTRLAQWYNQVEIAGLKSFRTLARTIQNHYQTILNFFDNRATNASAESFNAKIKALRSQFRGVRGIPFFMFRLAKIYA